MHLLQRWLENKKYKVKVTTNGEDVIKIVDEFQPQLVIVDILQNKAINELKQDEDTKYIPILLMSGYTSGNEKLHLEIDDVIEKPFNLPLLELKVAKLLKLE